MSAQRNILSLTKKYGLFLCIPLLLAGAYYYIAITYPQYKVSAKIAFKDVSSDSAVSQIKSKLLLQKSIDQLPLQFSFYNTASPKKELYGDSVPVKFVFNGSNKVNAETRLELAVLSDDQFTLNNNDTITYHKFSELVDEPYGKFIVIKNPQFKAYDRSFTIKMDEPIQLLNQYYANLHVEAGDLNNGITVSVLAGNSQKGVDLLNMLFSIYATASHYTTPVANNAPAKDNAGQINDDILILKGKAAVLIREINKLEEENSNSIRKPETKTGVDEKQRKIYEAIRPFMKKPLNQFVQVPYVDEIDDPDLNDEVNEYNETELSKQHLLAVAPGDNAQLDSANKKLMMLQSDIFEKISWFTKGGGSSVRSFSNNATSVRIRTKEDSLNQINRKLQAERDRYASIKTAPAKQYSASMGSPLVIIEKPEDNIEYIPVNELLIYALSLLAAAAILLAWWLLRHSSKKKRSYTSFDSKIGEKINNLFSEKQID